MIRLSIQNKLLVALLFATLGVIGYMGLVIQWGFDRGFLEYVNLEEQKEISRLAQQFEVYYAEHQSWDKLLERPLLILKMHAQTLPQGRKRDRLLKVFEEEKVPGWILEPDDDNAPKPRHPVQRVIMVGEVGQVIFGRKRGESLPTMIPILYQDKEVGGLGIYPPKEISEVHQLLFIKKQKLVILMVGIAAIFITIAITLPLAYHLTKPIRRLSETTRKLMQGDYSVRIASNARDELGTLTNDINKLAQTLEENEIQRKLWVSDIAHELRTPLTSLVGDIEALQDGIRQPNEQTYQSLHEGVTRLRRLVDDLYDLSRADAGILSLITEPIDLFSLVEKEIQSLCNKATDAQLVFELQPDPGSSTILGDPQRLQQLVDNLLTNSIRYTDPGGTISVLVSSDGDRVILDVMDSLPGVPGESLTKLFNRLYRVDQSRNRALGGSGLGLAICKQIVDAHGGTITAQHGPDGGLWIQVIFPAVQEQS